jgi:sugar lactone lactonase YvrE
MWSAIYAGGKLIRFDPDGAIDRVIELPVSHPTCCCFGGEALDALFVTSAIEPLGPQERTTEPLAGKVLAFKPGVRGRAEFKTRL